jgi:hypothetical protein
MTNSQTGKPRLPVHAADVNPIIVRSSLVSAMTVPNNLTSRMLKKSSFSSAQPGRAETRLVPCIVLGSSKSSTGTWPPHHSAARTDVVLLIRRTVRPRGYASGFDLTAALLNGHFEHPGWCSPGFRDATISKVSACRPSFSRTNFHVSR